MQLLGPSMKTIGICVVSTFKTADFLPDETKLSDAKFHYFGDLKLSYAKFNYFGDLKLNDAKFNYFGDLKLSVLAASLLVYKLTLTT
jgi:hypothetical protein